MNRKQLLLVLAIIGIFACATAQAGIIAGQDDDLDFLFTAAGAPKTSGAFAVGDVLVSVFELPTLTYNGDTVIPAGYEVTGLAVTQIASIGATTVTFQPYTGGFNFFSPVDVANGGAGQGAMTAIFLNDTSFNLALDFAANVTTNCTSFTQCATEATAGTLLQVDGFAGDGDQFWQAFGPVQTVEGFKALGGAQDVALYSAALTTFENNIPTTGTPIVFQTLIGNLPCPTGTTAVDGCIAGPTISGSINGGLGLNPALYTDGAFARSDIDTQKLTAQAVPEPATLMLMGIGLLGLAVTLRHRK